MAREVVVRQGGYGTARLGAKGQGLADTDWYGRVRRGEADTGWIGELVYGMADEDRRGKDG